jgi:hypothetical protein
MTGESCCDGGGNPALNKPDEEAYFRGMLPTRTYISRAFPQISGVSDSRLLRYASKVIDSENNYVCDVNVRELVIRQTSGDRQQIKALFFEDDRSIQTLIFQRFTAETNKPHRRQAFSFTGDEIDKIRWLVELVQRAEFEDFEKGAVF